MFTVQLIRSPSPIILGRYDDYHEAKERMAAILQRLSAGMVQILSPNGFVVDQEKADIFHRAD